MVQIAWQDLPATDVGSCSSQRELGIRGNPLKRPTLCVQVIARLKEAELSACPISHKNLQLRAMYCVLIHQKLPHHPPLVLSWQHNPVNMDKITRQAGLSVHWSSLCSVYTVSGCLAKSGHVQVYNVNMHSLAVL